VLQAIALQYLHQFDGSLALLSPGKSPRVKDVEPVAI